MFSTRMSCLYLEEPPAKDKDVELREGGEAGSILVVHVYICRDTAGDLIELRGLERRHDDAGFKTMFYQ